MSKGSKQRPTAQSFYDNWDDIFGDSEDDEEADDIEWECTSCNKELSDDHVYFVVEVDHEAMGDRTVERVSRIAHCDYCGQEVEYAG